MMTTKVCKLPECTRPHKAKGYCGKHHMRVWRYGDPEICKPRGTGATKPFSECLTPGCGEPYKARGRCSSCHAKWYRQQKRPIGRAHTIPMPLIKSVNFDKLDDPWLLDA